MPTLQPVDYDPFSETSAQPASIARVYIGPGAERAPSQQKTVPVEHDPFATPSLAEDVVKSAGVGAVKGGIGMVGAAGDVRDLLSAGVDYAAQHFGIPKDKIESFKSAVYRGAKLIPAGAIVADAPTSGDIQSGVERVTGEFYKPQTKAGEYAQTAGEFLPAAFGGEASAISRAARTLVPAAASETAGQATKGTKLEPVARFLGALTGAGAAALASRPGTASRSLASQLPEGITEPMVIRADALMQEASARGVQLAWPEALSQVAGRPVLTNMMRHLEASPQTEAQMAQFFGGRPQQVEAAVRQELGNIAPVNNAPSTIGRQIGTAAEDEANFVRRSINDASEPFYAQAATLTLTPEEMRQVRAIPGYREARDAVRGDPQLNRYVQYLPDNSIGFLNEVKKYLDTAGQNARAPVNAQRNMQRAAGYEQDATRVRNIARTVDDQRGYGDYNTALEIQERGRREILQPLLDGYIGKLAKQDLTTREAINALFPKNPLPNSQREIGDAVSTLARREPRAASDLVRAHIESVFNEAAKDLQSGANQAGGAKFRVQLIGNSQQAENVEAAVRALPHGDQRWRGMNKLLDVLEATGTRQHVGSRTAYNAELNKEFGSGGVARDAAKITANPARLAQPLIDKYEQWKLGKNLNELARLVTDRRSADLLRAIASAPNQSAAGQLAVRLVAFANGSRPEPVKSVANQQRD